MSDQAVVEQHDCLAEPENLEEHPDDRPGVLIRVCTVCGRRHFEVVAEPGDLRAESPSE